MVDEDDDYPAGDDAGLDPNAPDVEAKSSRPWLAMIKGAEEAFDDYQNRADNIDKLFSDLKRLANNTRDRQFQMFWANIQVLGPSIYSRPPVPVVVPRFKDRRPLYRIASEMLERSSIVAFSMTSINDVMLMVRDDLNILARGVAWVRYETKDNGGKSIERICVEHKDRKDFVHEPSRNWSEVGWVAGAGYMTKREMRKRFKATSGKAYQECSYLVRKDDKENGATDNRAKAKVWELWSKDENKVVWVSESCQKVLDEGAPHLKLEGFFPCPKPAYGTLQRRSLIPVPDVIFYRDQLEEVNLLTTRIHGLADALKVRGFYPAGASEIGEAVKTALKSLDDREVLVPVANWAAFGGQGGEAIVWLPIEQVSTTITQLVALRKQVIDDVYQIVGLSDIMRGSTEASETLGAQQLKSQYGSVRIRDKQTELVRVARDLVCIAAEIMAENFSPETLLDMSQMEIPSDADIEKQIEGVTKQADAQFHQQLEQAQNNPQLMEQAKANPDQAQQIIQQVGEQIRQQAQSQIDKLKQTVTIEQVEKFLRDQKIRPFVLDIETDSTIQPDEDAEKQRRAEFLTALSGTLQQLGPLVQAQPAAAPFAAEILKFAVAPFRAGRELEQAIEEFADQMAQQAQQPKAPDPAAEAAQKQADATERVTNAKVQQIAAETQQAAEEHQANMQIKATENEGKRQEGEARVAQIANEDYRGQVKHQQELDRGALEIEKLNASIEHQRVQTASVVAGATLKAASAQHSADLQERQAAQHQESIV